MTAQDGYDFFMSVGQHDIIPNFIKVKRNMAIGISIEQRKIGKGLKHLCSDDQTEKILFECMVDKIAEKSVIEIQSLNRR